MGSHPLCTRSSHQNKEEEQKLPLISKHDVSTEVYK
uniref:Uncharacterized protein n=1 Tax=Anguilla anguilla TaxID=7936 RepID=A0A0E9RDV9_ANGAN